MNLYCCLFRQSVSQSWQINFRKRVFLSGEGGCAHMYTAYVVHFILDL